MITQLSGQSLLVFAGIPILFAAVAALLVYAPSIAKGPRYRPGLSWWAPPVWINGPRPATDQAATDAPQLTTGDNPATAGTAVARTTGGASASW